MVGLHLIASPLGIMKKSVSLANTYLTNKLHTHSTLQAKPDLSLITLTQDLSCSKPTTVSEHFLTNDHSADDIILILLELTKSNRDSVRKAREAYLIERGKTLEPLGINKKDEM